MIHSSLRAQLTKWTRGQLQTDYVHACNVIHIGWVLSKTVSATESEDRAVNSEISKDSHCHSTEIAATSLVRQDKEDTCGPWVHAGPASHAFLHRSPCRGCLPWDHSLWWTDHLSIKSWQIFASLSPQYPNSPMFIKPACGYHHVCPKFAGSRWELGSNPQGYTLDALVCHRTSLGLGFSLLNLMFLFLFTWQTVGLKETEHDVASHETRKGNLDSPGFNHH